MKKAYNIPQTTTAAIGHQTLICGSKLMTVNLNDRADNYKPASGGR